MLPGFTRKLLLALLYACAGTVAVLAQTEQGLVYSCPPPDTVACLAEVPEPDPGSVIVTGVCDPDGETQPDEGAGDGADSGDGDGDGDGGTTVGCDTAVAGCYSAYLVEATRADDDASVTYAVRVAYGDADDCRHAVSNIAFALPEGFAALDYAESDTYEGELGRYGVENTTGNPFHSIKFESQHDGFEPGTSELYVFTVAAEAAYPGDSIPLRIKASTESFDLSVALGCDTVEEADEVVEEEEEAAENDYEVVWDYDYVVPGGTGCVESPIVILRSYSVISSCTNSAYCDQSIVIAGDCDASGTPQCEGGDASMLTVPVDVVYVLDGGDDAYATVHFDSSPEEEAGAIYEVWRPEEGERGYEAGYDKPVEGRSGASNPQLLGRIAADGSAEYAFAHESLDVDGPVQVFLVKQIAARTASTYDASPTAAMTAFPNPGMDWVDVSAPALSDGRAARLEVYNATGALMHAESVPAVGDRHATTVVADDFERGLYLIVLQYSNGARIEQRWLRQ